jgi:predicted short-subunit dehydrogenase-like oxidoreductase (DUF2520 family)
LDHITPSRALALVGPGRAGTSLALALHRRGWSVRAVAGRAPDAASTRRAVALLGDARAVKPEWAGRGCDLVIVATPDHSVAAAAAAVAGSLERDALVVHLSGVSGLSLFDALRAARPDVRLGALHPLQSLPSPELGADRLDGAWCAVEGPDEVARIAECAGLRPFAIPVDADSRAVYHAAACVASNHLVALLAQVERLAALAGVPFDAFLPLVRTTVENTAEVGPAAALTGPVARGDAATVAAHLAALPDDERDAYRGGASEALRLTGRDDPDLEALLQRVVA